MNRSIGGAYASFRKYHPELTAREAYERARETIDRELEHEREKRVGRGYSRSDYHYSIESIKRANRAAGQNWFDKGAMRFFKSRRYSVRRVTRRGSIETIGKMQQYPSLAAAKSAIKRLMKKPKIRRSR